MKREYKIVVVRHASYQWEETIEEMESKVTDNLNDGWELYGPLVTPSSSINALLQPMVRMVPDIKGTQAEGLKAILQ